jgi:Protein of unknown function (DUF1073)
LAVPNIVRAQNAKPTKRLAMVRPVGPVVRYLRSARRSHRHADADAVHPLPAARGDVPPRNLGETLTPSGDDLFRRADLFNNTRDNRGVMLLDKDDEDSANVSASLDQLQAQAQEHMGSVSRIPLVKLLGISPHGLNATAEPELRAFYDSIHAFQEKLFSSNPDRVFRFA